MDHLSVSMEHGNPLSVDESMKVGVRWTSRQAKKHDMEKSCIVHTRVAAKADGERGMAEDATRQPETIPVADQGSGVREEILVPRRTNMVSGTGPTLSWVPNPNRMHSLLLMKNGWNKKR
jgi:hypothetical protein